MVKVVVCIDESGVTSKIGHTTYSFVFILIENIKEIDTRIKYIEEELGIGYIHWSEMSWKRRMIVAKAIENINFSSLVYLMENPVSPDIELLNIFNKFYNRDIRCIKFYIDGDKPQRFIKKIKNEVNRSGVGHNKVSVLDDKKFAGLRLADFIAGAVRHFYDNDSNDEKSPVFKLIKNKLKIIKI